MADKLSNGKVVSTRFSAEGTIQLERLAAISKMEVCDYIRHLVALDSAAKHEQFIVLSGLFSGAKNGAMYASNTSNTQAEGASHPLTASQFGSSE